MMESFSHKLSIYEPIEFALEFFNKRFRIYSIDEPITIHTTCSSRKMGLEDKFKKISKFMFNKCNSSC